MGDKEIGIYKITNNITGNFYIGKSLDIKHRWYDHKRSMNYKQTFHYPLYRSFRKHGIENFTFEILELCNRNDLTDLEYDYILKLKPKYNQTIAKSNRLCHSEETKRKIGEASKRYIRNKEWYEKISKANTGRKHTEETKKKMSESKKGTIPWNKGKTNMLSKTALHLMSIAKQVSVKCVETGIEYESIQIAGKQFNKKHNHISEVLDKANRTAFGYHWERVGK